jgi:hypothetical protein
LIKLLFKTAKQFLWSEFKKLAPKKLETWKFDQRVLEACVEACREDVAINVKLADGTQMLFQKLLEPARRIRLMQKDANY